MRYLLTFLTLCLLIIIPYPLTAQSQLPAPSQIISGDTIQLELFFPFIKQGRVGVIRVVAPQAQSIKGTFLNRDVNFFQVEVEEHYYALLSVPLTQSQRDHELNVTVTTNANTQTLSALVRVTSGEFIQQNVTIVNDTINTLLDREKEDSELALLFSLASTITPVTYWQKTGFIHPIETSLTSPFGAVRLFNGTYETLHTGWDYQATLGQPMVASAGGVVVFNGRLDIRGNYVLVDHGNGVYSGYAHLSVSHVTKGQRIYAGQIIGQVGNTGRSSSAHAHIEFIINNQWIDSRDFLSLPIPK